LASFNASFHLFCGSLILKKWLTNTITLREKEGEWDLGLVLHDGAFTVVAHFDERGSAEEAYKAVQKAMLRARSADSGSSFVGLCFSSSPLRRSTLQDFSSAGHFK
jgi:hypothetical protein